MLNAQQLEAMLNAGECKGAFVRDTDHKHGLKHTHSPLWLGFWYATGLPNWLALFSYLSLLTRRDKKDQTDVTMQVRSPRLSCPPLLLRGPRRTDMNTGVMQYLFR